MTNRSRLFAALFLFLSACASSVPRKIEIIADPDANAWRTTLIDVVFVYEDDVEAALPHTGPDWFARKTAMTLAYGDKMDVVPLQMPPALSATVALPKRHGKAIAVLVFASYDSKGGRAVVNLSTYHDVIINLKRDEITYTGR